MQLIEHFHRDRVLHALLEKRAEYLGHSSPGAGIAPETLYEHVALVNRMAGQLADAHGLDAVIDRLIEAVVCEQPAAHRAPLRTALKRRFAYAIFFHDFGKINPHYQRERLKNTALSAADWAVPFFPVHGHSEAGAFLFTHYFLQEEVADEIQVFLDRMTVRFAYSIAQHHAKGKFSQEDFAKKVANWGAQYAAYEPFLRFYNWPTEAPMSPTAWAKWAVESVPNSKEQVGSTDSAFALHALLKLNFSLLTAADYLATSLYMSGRVRQPPTSAADYLIDPGVLSDELRQRILRSVRATEPYNREVFAALDDPAFEVEFPEERSNTRLNQLRRQMAVQALRTVDQSTPEQRIFYLEAPTGGGKTNVSMLAATRLLDRYPELNKLLYVFPFTTLATQTEAALRKVYGLEAHEVAEIHSRAPSPGEKSEEAERDGLYGRERKQHLRYLFFHYPIALVTHIRFFDWIKTNWKEPNYAYHRLANSVIILDEIQAYAPKHWDKVNFYLNRLARFFNIRFVIMSATLPRLDRLETRTDASETLAATAMLPEANRYLTNPNFARRVRFDFGLLYNAAGSRRKIELEQLRTEVLQRSEAYRAQNKQRGVYTIVEFIFKKSAGNFARLFPRGGYFDEVLVLSGTVLEPQRRRVINYLKNPETRRHKVLLVTTQVVEAGVDLDMDLGFKNTSLPDSDEQLAGRINRNVKKENCVLYLFHHDESKVLYGKDYRYECMRKLPPDAHRDILNNKNFDYLYNRVFGQIRTVDADDNLASLATYLNQLRQLNYLAVHDEFKLIDAQNESVFVPLDIPTWVAGAVAGTRDQLFTEEELDFCRRLDAFRGVGIADTLSGATLFDAYLQFVENPQRSDFILRANNFRRLKTIMSRFTFSLLKTPKLEIQLKSVCNVEKSQYGYQLLQPNNHPGLYTLEKGLNQDLLADGGDFIF